MHNNNNIIILENALAVSTKNESPACNKSLNRNLAPYEEGSETSSDGFHQNESDRGLLSFYVFLFYI